MKRINDEFDQVLCEAQFWGEKFEKIVANLKNYSDLKNFFENYICDCNRILLGNNQVIDNDVLKQYQLVFQRLNGETLKDFVDITNELKNSLISVEDCQIIHNNVEQILTKIQELQIVIPKFEKRHEVLHHENVFLKTIRKIEQEIVRLEQMFGSGDPVFEIFEINRSIFDINNTDFRQCQQSLNILQKIQETNGEFFDHYRKCADKWNQLLEKNKYFIENLHVITDKRNQYSERFENFVIWMDKVNEIVQNILQNEFHDAHDFDVQSKVLEVSNFFLLNYIVSGLSN